MSGVLSALGRLGTRFSAIVEPPGGNVVTAFSVDYVSPVSFHNLGAEICFAGQILCRVKSERPDGLVEADFFFDYRDPLSPVTVPLTEFLALVNEVMDEVVNLRNRIGPT